MLQRQSHLPLELPRRALDPSSEDRVERALGFVSAGLAAVLENLPLPRRTLNESTRALHLRVTLERRNGYCPCCQQTLVCDAAGKLPGAEFDHWYGRNRNAPDETWLICSPCNRE